MNPFTRACIPDQIMSRATLLGFLDSKEDTSKAIVVSSGEIIDLANVTQAVINGHLNDRTWVYFEERQPRRMLLTNPNWIITAYNPALRKVCVEMTATSGIRNLSFTLPAKF